MTVRRFVFAHILSALMIELTLCSTADAAQSDASLEGTWQLIAPQSLLKPIDGKLPEMTPRGKELIAAHRADRAKGDFSYDLTVSRCGSPGLPRLMLAPGRFKLYQRDDIVLMRFEWNRLFRQVSMATEKRVPLPVDSPIRFDRSSDELLFGTMIGKSYGHWAGKTLVVESDGFSEKKLLDNELPNSEELTLTETFRLVDHDMLEDRIRIVDPQIFAQPWETVLRYKRVAAGPFPEDVCIDRKHDKQVTWPH